MNDLLEEYQKFCHKGVIPTTAAREPILGFALGLGGEAGEVIDDIKKRMFHGRSIPMEHTKEELGDVMWYIANIANEYGFTLEDIIRSNMDKLNKRYPEMYGSNASAPIPLGQQCPGCGYDMYNITQSGPHIKAVCAHCGKFYKFLSKEEVKNGDDDLPWY